jgi:NADPH-dependent 2,4-dienoyl-CoA reductase/sulfur reductase-like enzyme
MSWSFDLVVVGAGPGGIAAATVAAEAGLRVCLLDDNQIPGGQIWRGFRKDSAKQYPNGNDFLHWADRLQRTTCEVGSGWQAIDRPKPNLLRLERNGELRDVEFRRLVLATGARERFLPFPGWTLPGVTGAGGLQALVKAGLDVRGKRVVVAGTGPLLLAITAGLADKGAVIEGIYDQAPIQQLIRFGFMLGRFPGKLAEGLRYRRKLSGTRYRTGSWVVRGEGSGHLQSVTLTDGRKEWTVSCDFLACGFHLVPNLELPLLLGCRIVNGYVPVDWFQQTTVPGIAAVGELTGIGGLDKALLEGEIAGWASVDRTAEARPLLPRLKRMRDFATCLDRAFALRNELRTLPTPQTLLCRCEDVTYDKVAECGSMREAKLHTRCGMGACQGRVCGSAAEFLFGWEHGGARPPLFPTRVSTIAASVDSR